MLAFDLTAAGRELQRCVVCDKERTAAEFEALLMREMAMAAASEDEDEEEDAADD